MDSTVATATQAVSQHGDHMWTSFVVFLCLLACVYLLMFYPATRNRHKQAKQWREVAHTVNASTRSKSKRMCNSHPDTVEPDQRLIAEIHNILMKAKPFKEIRPNDVRQHLNANGWNISEARILRAMDDLTDMYYFVDQRSTRKGQLIIWRIPEEPADTLPAQALFYEDVK